jgi:hypothetical protein
MLVGCGVFSYSMNNMGAILTRGASNDKDKNIYLGKINKYLI